MITLRKTAAALGATALLAAPIAALSVAPAHAADRDFRCAGAEVDFDVEEENGRFDVDVDVDEATRGSKWRVTLRHDGKVFHNRVHRADGDGEIDIDKLRRNTAGKDTFRLTVTPVGGQSCTSTITRR